MAGKIDYDELKKVKRDVESIYQTDDTKMQSMPISLNKDVGTIDLTSNISSSYLFENPLDKYNSYKMTKLYLLGTDNSVFKNLGTGIEHELMVEMTRNVGGNDKKHLFVFFPIKSMTLDGGRSASRASIEFSKIIQNNGSGQKNINLDHLINKDNTGSFYLTSENNDKYIIIYEEPILYNKKFNAGDLSQSSEAVKALNGNVVWTKKYYSGGSYYTECDEVDVDDDDGKSSAGNKRSSPPEIKWEKYYSYIIGIISGLFLVLICWIFLTGGGKLGKWGYKFLSSGKKADDDVVEDE